MVSFCATHFGAVLSALDLFLPLGLIKDFSLNTVWRATSDDEIFRFIHFTTEYPNSPLPLFSVCVVFVSPQIPLKFMSHVEKCSKMHIFSHAWFPITHQEYKCAQANMCVCVCVCVCDVYVFMQRTPEI
jgi:hypothetical protein